MRDVAVTSEFRKDFDGAGMFSMSFNGKTENGITTSGFAKFDTEDLGNNSVGIKISGEF